jgi:hypothetical protein
MGHCKLHISVLVTYESPLLEDERRERKEEETQRGAIIACACMHHIHLLSFPVSLPYLPSSFSSHLCTVQRRILNAPEYGLKTSCWLCFLAHSGVMPFMMSSLASAASVQTLTSFKSLLPMLSGLHSFVHPLPFAPSY